MPGTQQALNKSWYTACVPKSSQPLRSVLSPSCLYISAPIRLPYPSLCGPPLWPFAGPRSVIHCSCSHTLHGSSMSLGQSPNSSSWHLQSSPLHRLVVHPLTTQIPPRNTESRSNSGIFPTTPVHPKMGAEPLAHLTYDHLWNWFSILAHAPDPVSSDPGATVWPRVYCYSFQVQAPAWLSFSISSVSGPLDFEAYSAAALQEGKYVWAWMPRLDHGIKGGRAEWGGGTPRAQQHPSSVLSNETFAGSQSLSPSRTEPAGAGATCSCVRKHPAQPWPRLAQDLSPCPGYPKSPLLQKAQEYSCSRLDLCPRLAQYHHCPS